MSKTIQEWQFDIHALARKKGWYDDRRMTPEWLGSVLANIHGEVSEAFECVRARQMATYAGAKGKPEGLPIELADIIIRTLDLCQFLEIDIEAAMRAKHEFNKTRPHRHGGKVL